LLWHWQPVPDLLVLQALLDHKARLDRKVSLGQLAQKVHLAHKASQDQLDRPVQPKKSWLPTLPAPNVIMTLLCSFPNKHNSIGILYMVRERPL
jgi:hypothetical protein